MKILDSNNQVVFYIDPANKVVEYPHNETLKQELKKGIAIPPYAQSSFNNNKVVYPPHPTADQKLFELFEQAVLFRYEQEYKKHNFKISN